MEENPHYKELLRTLNDYEVEYLIVGGYAVMKYTEPRYTKDLDVWVRKSVRANRKSDLIANKEAAGRDNDLEHLRHLRAKRSEDA